MKATSLLLYTLLLLAGLSSKAQPKHEIRAVWLTTIGGLDWPHSYARNDWQIAAQKQELCQILDQLQAAHVNTVLLQTRIRATTIYPSEYEPWDGCLSGLPGQGPGYDALQTAIEECHRRGMELHAWVVCIPIGKWNALGCRRIRAKNPSMVRRIGEEGYLNPEHWQTADYIADICEEITCRYDIDGIHLDYIRYPETWNVGISRQQARNHITNIVKRVSQKVKAYKPWVKLSCSPIGKYSDLTRYSSHGWNAYSRGCQDAQAWLRDGLMDALFPMMYFDGNQFFPFVFDWQEHAYGRMVSAGLGIYLLSPSEGRWKLEAVKRQMNVARQLGLGHAYFRSKFFTDNVKGVYDFACDFDSHPALIPPMAWAQRPAPTAPTHLWVEHTSEGDNLSWYGAVDRSGGPYLLYNVYASTEPDVNTDDPANLLTTRLAQPSLSLYRDATKPPLYYAVTALDRYGQESAPLQSHSNAHEDIIASRVLLPNNGQLLPLPSRQNETDAEFVAVKTLQGKIVATDDYDLFADISQIPEGMYQLTTLSRKGITHHIGFFIIKRH